MGSSFTLEELLEFLEPEKSRWFTDKIKEAGYPKIAEDFLQQAGAIDREKLVELIRTANPEADGSLGVDSTVLIEKDGSDILYDVHQAHSKIAQQAEYYYNTLGSGPLVKMGGVGAIIRLANFWEMLGNYYAKLHQQGQVLQITQGDMPPYMQKAIASFYAAWDNFLRVDYRASSGKLLVDRVKSVWDIELSRIKTIRDHIEHPKRYKHVAEA